MRPRKRSCRDNGTRDEVPVCRRQSRDIDPSPRGLRWRTSVSGYYRPSQIGLLEAMFERDPVVPHIVQRTPEDMFEIACVERFGAVRPAKPFDRPFRAVSQPR